jgi:hypothetical protein
VALALAVAVGASTARADFLVPQFPAGPSSGVQASGDGFEPLGKAAAARHLPRRHAKHSRSAKGGLLELLARRAAVLSTVLFLPPDSGPPPTNGGGSTTTGGSPGSTTGGTPSGGHPHSTPEPSTLLAGLIGAGAVGLFLWLRARKQRALVLTAD